jgi:thiol:disulfide interchange protein
MFQLRRLLSFVFVLLLTATASAQPGIPKPVVSAKFNTTTLTAGGQHVIAVVMEVPKGFHAQSATPSSADFIAFVLTVGRAEGVVALPPVYAKGVDRTYPALGTLNVYDGRVVTYVPVVVQAGLAAETKVEVRGTVTVQLCDDKFCFEPQDLEFVATADVGTGPPVPNDAEVFAGFDWSVFASGGTAPPPPPATRPTQKFTETLFGWTLSLNPDSYVVNFGLAIFVGVIFNLMPCVLPVLPIKAVGFYEAAAHSRSRSIFLGSVFTVGMLGAFTALGVLISLLGFQWGQLFQYGWFVWGMAVVLLVMAASMWGAFTLNLPSSVYSFEPRHDTVGGNLFFGAFTALLSTPCTAPIFPVLVAWAVSKPPALAIAFFAAVGLGMALPYLILSAFPDVARKFPRTGPWSELIKQFLGFFVLGTAVFLIAQRYLPGMTFMYPLLGLAVVAAVFLVARTLRFTRRPAALATVGVLALLLVGTTAYATYSIRFQPVAWVKYSDAALAEARGKGHVVIVKFTANWCANCHVVERTVFTDKDVLAAINSRQITMIKVDITQTGAPGSELLRRLSPAGGIPLTAVYRPGEAEPRLLLSIYTASALLEAIK